MSRKRKERNLDWLHAPEDHLKKFLKEVTDNEKNCSLLKKMEILKERLGLN